MASNGAPTVQARVCQPKLGFNLKPSTPEALKILTRIPCARNPTPYKKNIQPQILLNAFWQLASWQQDRTPPQWKLLLNSVGCVACSRVLSSRIVHVSSLHALLGSTADIVNHEMCTDHSYTRLKAKGCKGIREQFGRELKSAASDLRRQSINT